MAEKEEKQKFDMRGKSKNPNKLRNMAQYRGLSDEEFQAVIDGMQTKGVGGSSKAFEERIENELAKFENDYDLSDMKINDRAVLRNLVQSIISLEQYEQDLYLLRESGGITADNVLAIQKLQNVMSELRNDISKMQNDLSITRKHRRSDQETSVLAYIESLKEKARKFVEARSQYYFCPKCHTLLSTAWYLYPQEKNEVTLICKQKDKDGVPCNTKVKVNSKQALENRGTNDSSVMPQSML
jgi:hypothetical protein